MIQWCQQIFGVFMSILKKNEYQKQLVEHAAELYAILHKFFSNKRVVKVIKDHFPFDEEGTPADALMVACCQIMVHMANVDGKFTKEEVKVIKKVTGMEVDVEKAKNFAPTYFVNQAGVPLIAACACYAEEYFLQVDGKHHKVSDMLGQLLDLVASITIHADGNSDMLELLEKVYFMKNTHLFFAEYKRTHKAGYVVWTFNLDQYLPKQ